MATPVGSDRQASFRQRALWLVEEFEAKSKLLSQAFAELESLRAMQRTRIMEATERSMDPHSLALTTTTTATTQLQATLQLQDSQEWEGSGSTGRPKRETASMLFANGSDDELDVDKPSTPGRRSRRPRNLPSLQIEDGDVEDRAARKMKLDEVEFEGSSPKNRLPLRLGRTTSVQSSTMLSASRIQSMKLGRAESGGRLSTVLGPSEVPKGRSTIASSEAGDTLGDPCFDPTAVQLHLPADWPECIQLRQRFADNPAEADAETVASHRHYAITRSKIRTSREEHQPLRSNFLERLNICYDKITIRPTNSRRHLFDVLKFMLLLYDLTSTPFVLAWELKPSKLQALFLTIFWLVDILMNFCTGFYSHGHLEMRGATIAANYLRTGFALDIVLASLDVFSMTYDFTVADYDDDDGEISAVKAARLVRILRLLRLMRLGAVRSLSDQMLEKLQATQDMQLSVTILRLFLFLFWLNHTISCAWYFISRRVHSDTGLRWVTNMLEPNGLTYLEASKTYQYCSSLHWALTQMTPASMQVAALNTAERIFSICWLSCGTLIFTLNVSLLSAKLTQRMMSSKKVSDQQQTLERFLRQGNISRNLSVEIKRQVIERMGYKRFLSFEDVADTILTISYSLQKELKVGLWKPHLLHHELFHFCHRLDEKSCEALSASACSMLVCSARDTLFMPGADTEGAYLLVNGTITYTQTPDFARVSVETSDHITEGDWLSQASLWTTWMHVGKAEVNAASLVMRVDAGRCLAVLNQNYAIWDVVSQYAKHFLQCLIDRSELEDWPSDMEQPKTLPQVVQWMDRETRVFIGTFALQSMRKSKRRMYNLLGRFSNLRQLEQELMTEQCSLTVGAKDEIVRVTSVVVVRIQGSDGRIFLQIGKRTMGKTIAECRLPGAPCRSGQEAEPVLQLLLAGKLAPLNAFMQVRCMEKVMETKKSRTYNVLTHYLQSVYSAVYNHEELQMQKVELSAASQKMLPPELPAQAIYSHRHDSIIYYFAWVSQQELKKLSLLAPPLLDKIRVVLEELAADDETNVSSWEVASSSLQGSNQLDGPPRMDSKVIKMGSLTPPPMASTPLNPPIERPGRSVSVV